ncbi:hypothetical protein [Campylobacter concisus]|jgi:hypothetical protein|uniref:hypothetical protein n=1 Tax=Campylobacter concisus TaxID=199 RepID=UPI000CD867CC|nr:hypothetical protein [Campylobacter concisus]
MNLKDFALQQSKLLKENLVKNQDIVIQNIIAYNLNTKKLTREDIEEIIGYMQKYGADFKMLNESYDNQKELSILSYIKLMVQEKIKKG